MAVLVFSILLIFGISTPQIVNASGRKQDSKFHIEVKQTTCPSGGKTAPALNLICEIDDGSKWSWNSTALFDQGNTLKIFESIKKGQIVTAQTRHPIKPKAPTTTQKPKGPISSTTPRSNNTHHPTSCNLVWVDASQSNASQIPHKLLGGHEANGEKLYVCRTADPHDVNSFPGKFSSRQNVCVISWIPDRVYTAHFQVLTNPNGVPMRWVADRRGHVPPKTWLGGEVKVHSHPSAYYVGRVKAGRSLQVGKIKVKGEYVIAYVNNRHYPDYRKAKDRHNRGDSRPYYYNLNNYKQLKSDSYEALVCPY
ncbi:hypothetical protein TYRP_007550 [Tyrophagus putrescentiae]|nr:hypothetical protein TYRP_007550 [Tyrophagus putrescentiae]